MNLNGCGPGYEVMAGFWSEVGGTFENRGYKTILGFVHVSGRDSQNGWGRGFRNRF